MIQGDSSSIACCKDTGMKATDPLTYKPRGHKSGDSLLDWE